MKRIFQILMAAILLSFLSSTAQADVVIAVANHDFEVASLGDGAFNLGGISSWTKSGGNGGNLNPANNFYTDALILDAGMSGGVIGTMDGPNVSFGLNSTTISQILTTSVVVGLEYLLEVSIGDRNVGGNATQFAGYALELWDGDSLLATTGNVSSSPGGEGTFADDSLSYTAQAGDAGLLEIRLATLGGGGGTDFDNVRLTAVPEPSSMAIIVLGSGIALLRRRKS